MTIKTRKKLEVRERDAIASLRADDVNSRAGLYYGDTEVIRFTGSSVAPQVSQDFSNGISIGGTAINATAAEINNAADVSARAEEHTGAGAVTAGVQCVEINSVAAAALTIADAANHQGLFIVKHTSSSDGQNHTLTLTSGTFDGTNNVALLDAAEEALVVYFDSGGDGTIVENVGSVSLG